MPTPSNSPSRPKYAKPEIERRWQVPRGAEGLWADLTPDRIDDRYLTDAHGTPRPDVRLRLRRVTSAEGRTVYKLGKKYGDIDGAEESVTSLYLSEPEYVALSRLAGASISKRRYRLATGSVDVYDSGEIIFSVEFDSQAEANLFEAPSFVGDEQAPDSPLSGYHLALHDSSGQD